MSEKELQNKIRELENQVIMMGSQLEWIQSILDGKEVSDFALSFPIIRQVQDLMLMDELPRKGIKRHHEKRL